MKITRLTFFLMLCVFFVFCGKKSRLENREEAVNPIKNHEKIEVVRHQLEKLVPVKISFDASGLSENQKKAVLLMAKAARIMDHIFLDQVYGQNLALKEALEKSNNPDDEVLREYLKVNFGPFDRLEFNRPFINLDTMKPAGANFYPQDMTKEEFQTFIRQYPENEKTFQSEFTVIRRQDGALRAIPYSQAYRDRLESAAALLKEAAQLVENASLKTYLISRSEAFLSNDYYQSDIDWVLLKDHQIELVIGPYEVYEDELFGYKAAFESFITLVDREESDKLAVLAKYLDDMERHLPIEDPYKNFNRGKSSPIVVVNEIFTGGDTKAGIQTTAFNLPNDERVRESTGSKKVMLKNIARAKFDHCWVPIVKEVLAESDLPFISFDSYFNHVLMHEIAHGLGPGIINKEGAETTVNKALKELYSTIEETKADIVGLYCFQQMIEKGIFPKQLQENIYVTYLGGIFRSVRFGTHSAHGGGTAIQLNYILEKGGFRFHEKEVRFSVNPEKIMEAIRELARELLMIQALGDYEKARILIEKYRKVLPELRKALDKVQHVPVDIRPIYEIEELIQ